MNNNTVTAWCAVVSPGLFLFDFRSTVVFNAGSVIQYNWHLAIIRLRITISTELIGTVLAFNGFLAFVRRAFIWAFISEEQLFKYFLRHSCDVTIYIDKERRLSGIPTRKF